ncbi:MAG TPA: outer membrane beta-barrel protein, partial [Acidobacteriaceae bacterium]|nr:outer membrane beta-barrel protein [Acidobacteriaceae bacterium]
GYFSWNANRPASQTSGYYNFDELNQFNLEAAKLTINHDPDPVGVHADILFGRTNTDLQSNGLGVNNIEQAYISLKPAKAKGFELDFGQFVTSAGQEVIETMNNWSYSHGLLFTYAIPYYHFGLRTSMPVTKTWTFGVQVVNGWNNVTDNNGGVTIGLTSSLVKPKFTWNTNYYVGPENSGLPPQFAGTQKGYRNLFDTTLLLTPTAKFNAYINYDYGQNRIPAYTSTVCGEGCANITVKSMDPHWQGIAFSARGQVTGKAALVGRYEYFYDNQGFELQNIGGLYSYSSDYFYSNTLFKTNVQEFTGTYEYKWLEGLLMRAEYRYDWSNKKLYNYGNDVNYGTGLPTKTSQQTLTVALIAFFGPKR